MPDGSGVERMMSDDAIVRVIGVGRAVIMFGLPFVMLVFPRSKRLERVHPLLPFSICILCGWGLLVLCEILVGQRMSTQYGCWDLLACTGWLVMAVGALPSVVILAIVDRIRQHRQPDRNTDTHP